MDEWTGMRLVDRGGVGGAGRGESRQHSARNLEVLLRGDKDFLGGGGCGQIRSGTQLFK